MACGFSSGVLPQEASVRFAKYFCYFFLFGSQVHAGSIDKYLWAVCGFVAQHGVMQQVPHSIKVLCLSIIFVDRTQLTLRFWHQLHSRYVLCDISL